jgi:TetR/AcrR family transcriptional regulator, cholesterol catabolism regulator
VTFSNGPISMAGNLNFRRASIRAVVTPLAQVRRPRRSRSRTVLPKHLAGSLVYRPVVGIAFGVAATEVFAAIEEATAQYDGTALDRLNALLRAGFDVKIRMGTPEHLAAMVSLLRPENAHLYGRIVAVSEDLVRPLLTRVISDAVQEGVFHTFDPEGVADMILGLSARVNANVVQIVGATDESARDHAIEVLTSRLKLHGLAVDRILEIPDGSVTVLDRVQVEIMVAPLPRNY